MSSFQFSFELLSRSLLSQMWSEATRSGGHPSFPPLSPSSVIPAPSSARPPPKPLRVPCDARTVTGDGCKNHAKLGLPYCYAHRNLSPTKNTDCPICLEEFNSGDADVFLLSCAHQLHGGCLAQLRNDSCPICRSPFTNVPKTLHSEIRERKSEDVADRSEEDFRAALEHARALGQVFRDTNFVVQPMLVQLGLSDPSPFEAPLTLTSRFLAETQLSVSDILEDLVAQRILGTSGPLFP